VSRSRRGVGTTGTAEATGGTFAGIVGNAGARRVLERALGEGPSHAYLFHGPEGVGKRTVARRFGTALVSGGDASAADRALRGLHPDLIEVEPEGQFTTIGQVREVVRGATSRPFEGARRSFLLRADTLNVQAANALLKTLEEPEGPSVFVLLAPSREAVLPTVVSRAQPVRFDPVPTPEVAAFLESRGHGPEEAELAAALGRGSVGLALRYAEDAELRGLRETVFGAWEACVSGSFEERHRASEEVLKRAEALGAAREAEVLEGAVDGGDGVPDRGPGRRAKEAAKRAGRAARDGALAEALGLLALLSRDAAAVAAGAGELAANPDRLVPLRERVAERPRADWAGAAREAVDARAALAYNVAPEAILEAALSRTGRRIAG